MTAVIAPPRPPVYDGIVIEKDRFIDRLVRDGLVSRVDVGLVVADPAFGKLPMERALVEAGLLDENKVLEVLSSEYGLALVHLSAEMLDLEVARKLPQGVLSYHCVYPLQSPPAADGSHPLRLAMSDPFDVNAEDTLRYLTGRKIERVLAPRQEILRALRGELGPGPVIDAVLHRISRDQDLEYVERVVEEEEKDGELELEHAAPIIQLVNSIVGDAIRTRASDIHVEPMLGIVRVRYRIDGLLRTVAELPRKLHRPCVLRFKLISGMDIAESRRPQDGRARVRFREREVDLRVSTVPSFHGEKVVLRLLDRAGAEVLDMKDLGLLGDDFRRLQGHFRASHGMILITGPTGSGKTSTLYSGLKILNRQEINILTIEDPIEYQLEGISQVQVNHRAGLTFSSALRCFLRQDPDVIMVGEIRDLDTAETAVQAAQTGHLVLSTLHTNDAPSTIPRLIVMGVKPYLVAGCLLCVVAQRLVRKLCPACRRPAEPTPDELELLAEASEGVHVERCFRSTGCEACTGTGFLGRLGIFEVLTVTDEIREQMMVDTSEKALWDLARSQGMRTLLEDGVIKVETGMTSLEELLRVVTIRRSRGPVPADGVAPLPRGADFDALLERAVRV
ncbi:MAG: type II/IV secretion system protein [Armatimonadetes bacterium]|nr:type II/IV secretion system protein [Armatimonadota bacterium]